MPGESYTGTENEARTRCKAHQRAEHLLLLAAAPLAQRAMISVVIPTLNAETGLAATLTALVTAAVEGLVREVIVVDGGSRDRTREIADHAGAEVIASAANRGAQLAAGAARAKHSWLLFLHADTVLDPGWERGQSTSWAGRHGLNMRPRRSAIDDDGAARRMLEGLVRLRCSVLRLPCGARAC
jgi:glycosyltransferase involved in cell wall biosynthesis